VETKCVADKNRQVAGINLQPILKDSLNKFEI
jgi:hypothetical protein